MEEAQNPKRPAEQEEQCTLQSSERQVAQEPGQSLQGEELLGEPIRLISRPTPIAEQRTDGVDVSPSEADAGCEMGTAGCEVAPSEAGSCPAEGVASVRTESEEGAARVHCSAVPSTEAGALVAGNVAAGVEAQAADAPTDEDDEQQSAAAWTRYTSMDFDAQIRELERLLSGPLTAEIRGQIDIVRKAFYTNLRAMRDEEQRKLGLEGGDMERYEPTHIPAEERFKELMLGYREQRKKQAQDQEAERNANLAAKREIIDKIRELTTRAEVKGETYKEFDALRSQWKQIGFVPQAEAEDLYQSYYHQVQSFYDYLQINRELRDLDYRKNFEEKVGLCERAEGLIAHKDPVKAFQELQELHAQWKEIGPVMREKSDELWERFSKATSLVNANHRQYFEDRKKVLEANLAKKTEFCELAEGIAGRSRERIADWAKDAKELIELQRQWRTLGPVPRKHNNKIWVRFQNACESFFTARREFEREQRREGMENIQRKLDLCAQAEGLKESTDWRKTTAEMIDLQRQWKEVGYTPYKRGNELWERFRAAMDYYFERRKAHSAGEREEQKTNLQAKEALLAELESFDLGSDVQKAIERLKDIQSRWNAIGFVPIKQKDKLQERYRGLLDKLYDALRVDRREMQMQSFKSRVEQMSSDGGGSSDLRRERDGLNKRVKALEAERIQMETNMSFFSASSQDSPILVQLEGKLQALQDEIAMVREKVKLLDKQSRRSGEKE